MSTAEITYTAGQIVQYANPENEAEALLRFRVIEDRDTRLFVAVIGHQGLGATESFAKSNYVLAND